jgi:hypothetical protein
MSTVDEEVFDDTVVVNVNGGGAGCAGGSACAYSQSAYVGCIICTAVFGFLMLCFLALWLTAAYGGANQAHVVSLGARKRARAPLQSSHVCNLGGGSKQCSMASKARALLESF